ncbi:MAG TPA: sigma-70 family RNA polymerase sigma factor [Burkholderiaceae bacterium]|nr:sigma-70 family RNA polymerase sigma factor [Burkholderiaceae bacterium]
MDTARIDRELAALRPQLLRVARLQLRNDAWAEDAVSETLIAALEGRERFGGQSQLSTWVVGILKHKIIDQFRRAGREVSVDAISQDSGDDEVDNLFRADGHRVSHPLDWGDPETSLARVQFFDVLQACIERLPAHLARIFMMREWLEIEIVDICKELGITATNCSVMMFRARMRLRECLETNGFGQESGT